MLRRLILLLFLILTGSGTVVFSQTMKFRQYMDEAREAMLDGIYGLGIGLYFDALDACPRDSVLSIAEINMGIGWGYSEIGEKEKALQSLDKSLGIYRLKGDSIGVAFCCNYYGLAYFRAKEYAIADRYFNRALSIFRKNNRQRQIVAVINNLCMSPGNSEEKVELLLDAIKANRKLNNIRSITSNFNNLGRQYYYLMRFDDALIALDHAKEYAEESGSNNQLAENYQIRSLVYAAQKDYPMAYNALSKVQEIEEKIKDADNKHNAKRIIEAKDDSADIGGFSRRNAVIVLVVALFAILAAVVAYLLHWRRLKKKISAIGRQVNAELTRNKQNCADLEQKGALIESMGMELQVARGKLAYLMLFMRSRNELLEKIRGMIRETYKMDPALQLVHLKKINSFIAQYLQDPKTYDQYASSEEEECTRFMEEFEKRYPLVTDREKSFALLLRLDLSPKEISLITGSAPKTVSMNRYRLRKHMNLNPTDDLISILRAI